MDNNDRRSFLKKTALVTGALSLGSALPQAIAKDPVPKNAEMTTRKLGRIGTKVSILGAGLGSVFTRNNNNPDKARAILEAALKSGVTYYDTAASYGPSEELCGPFVKAHRDEIFLVSKSGRRDYDGFMRELDRALTRLQTDTIDLYHIHNLRGKDKDLKNIENGAVKAARKAIDEGKIKHFGVTGHSGAKILVDAMKAWDPAAVLTIYPADRPDNGRYEDDILPLAKEKNIGVIGMKCVRFARNSDLKGSDLIRYGLSLDGVDCVIVGLDTEGHLKENVAMASNFKPLDVASRHKMTKEVQLALAGQTAPWDVPGYDDAVVHA